MPIIRPLSLFASACALSAAAGFAAPQADSGPRSRSPTEQAPQTLAQAQPPPSGVQPAPLGLPPAPTYIPRSPPAASPSSPARASAPQPAAEPWAQRASGRLFARRLASAAANDANLAGRHPRTDVGVWSSDPAYTQPVIDALGLRFDIETGKGINDWYFKLPQPFGANSKFYLQWRQRFNAAFIDTVFRTSGGGHPGIKLAIISEFNGSSTWPKLVVSTLDQHKFPFLYQYDQNGSTKNLMRSASGGADYDWQPKVGLAGTCLYSVNKRTPNGQPTPGCDGLVADKWITFDLEVLTEDLMPGTNTWHCDRKLFMTIDGERRLVVHYSSHDGGVGRNARPWTGVWLSPYMTARDGAQTFPVTPSVWYREVIVDDKPIPPPLDA